MWLESVGGRGPGKGGRVIPRDLPRRGGGPVISDKFSFSVIGAFPYLLAPPDIPAHLVFPRS